MSSRLFIAALLGWRPGGDLSGFQAALTGAFQLKENEGHTEWTWQQRGYSVQADMGALVCGSPLVIPTFSPGVPNGPVLRVPASA